MNLKKRCTSCSKVLKMNSNKLKEYINLFILENEFKGNSKRTIKQYKSTLGYFVDYIEENNISEITNNTIKEYQKNLLERNFIGNELNKGKANQKISRTTVNSYMTPIRTFCNFLYDENYLDYNLFEKVNLVKKPKKIHEILTEEQIEKVLMSFKNNELSIRNQCLFLLFVDSGLRLSETYSLNVSDVIFNSNMIKINNSKGFKDRLVPMSLTLKKSLYKYLTLYRIPDSMDDDALLLTKDKSRMTDKAVTNVIRRMKYKLNFKKFNPHMLRHTFATRYIINGGDMFSLQLILGHEDIETVRKYVHLARYYMSSDYDKISTANKIVRKNLSIKI